jgi:integrase/recombinase XerD
MLTLPPEVLSVTTSVTQKALLSASVLCADANALASWANKPLDVGIASVLSHFLVAQPSQNTRKAYGRDVLEFLNFCADCGCEIQRIEEVSEKLILRWKENLNKKHSKFEDSRRRVASSSVARKLCSLASMMEFAFKRKLITVNPFEHVTRPKVRRQSHATVLTEEEVRLLLKEQHSKLLGLRARRDSGNPKTMRLLMKAETEWCVLVLLFTVGMRVSELCALKIEDISHEGDLIRLHLFAKGGQQHSPLIHPDTAAILLSYIAQVHPYPQPPAPVFPAVRKPRDGHTQQGIHRSQVFRIVQKAAREAGIHRAFSPHGCRATLATQLHMNQVPLVEIQTLLNHAQVTTTQLYLHRVHELQEAAALQLPWSSQPNSRLLRPKAE